ncbi:MAG: bifunctional phosphopantothenoylcysteine decarboxylase/phosphopantothenate--cysteine ligase CoaBC [Halothermotrichaceae bacterium]
MEKNILLGITGGIAAYKMASVASTLTKMGHSVHAVMTEGGTKFVTPLTFQNITHNPVEVELFTPPVHYDVKHISLADRADICLIAPATANFIGKIAGGIADDLLSTIVMATNAPILISPSMNVNMYNNPVFQDNLAYLKEKGYKIIKPASGRLACGYEGKGRLPEPEELVENIIAELTVNDFVDEKVLITAGPTREPLDPVRYLSNYSSGKMGYELARAAVNRGAEVTLISGPTNLQPPAGVETIFVENAQTMNKEVQINFKEKSTIIMTAAVADFKPAEFNENKIKKDYLDYLTIELKPNPDILAGIGQKKKDDQLLVGFAAESKNLIANAQRKLNKKNLDMIIANEVSNMGSDQNQATVLTEDYIEEIPMISKAELADIILDKIKEYKK